MIDESRVMARLIKDEGEVLHLYFDHLGFASIGVGRMIDVRRGGGISPDESRYLLRNDIARITAQCEQRFGWLLTLDDARQGVILCMAFQLGIGGVANFRKMIDALVRKDYEAAADEMLDSGWHKQTPKRCELMAQIMKTGDWPE
jgi:lysozyme